MNKNRYETNSYLDKLTALNNSKPETNIIICPPYTSLDKSIDNISLGAQNINSNIDGAYTGEVLVRASTLDEAIEFSDARTYSFERPSQQDSFFSKNFNGPTMVAAILGFIVLAAILVVIRRQRITIEEEEVFVAGPPISQQQLIQSSAPVEEEVVIQDPPTISGPPLPDEGLPAGWSMEQWVHYGQQYLDRLGKQP